MTSDLRRCRGVRILKCGGACTWVVCLCAGLLTVLAACRPVQGLPQEGQAGDVKVTVERAGDVALVDAGNEAVTVAIMSPGGIGGAEVAWPMGTQPGALHVNLYLGGLEELRLSNGTTEVIASVPSRPPYTASASTGDGAQLVPGDGLWPAIEIVAAEGEAPAIPLQGGYFHVVVPPALLTGEAPRLHVSWIDFYR